MSRPRFATRSRQVREQAGLSLQEAARLVGVTPRYLGRCERAQRFSYPMKLKCSRRYGRFDDFTRHAKASG